MNGSHHILSLMVISRRYKGSRLTNKEMKASSALPVGLQIRREVILHRPTQGWTVREYILRCKSIQASSTVQPWVGRWRRESSPSRRQTKSAPGAFSPNALIGICWTKMLISSAEAVKMPGKACLHAFLEKEIYFARLGGWSGCLSQSPGSQHQISLHLMLYVIGDCLLYTSDAADE